MSTAHPDDILIWADGTTATREDYREATEEEIEALNASLLATYERECSHR